jgi:hypothetical protein
MAYLASNWWLFLALFTVLSLAAVAQQVQQIKSATLAINWPLLVTTAITALLAFVSLILFIVGVAVRIKGA